MKSHVSRFLTEDQFSIRQSELHARKWRTLYDFGWVRWKGRIVCISRTKSTGYFPLLCINNEMFYLIICFLMAKRNHTFLTMYCFTVILYSPSI